MEPRPVVQLNSVTKRFAGGTIGVSGVDLSIATGEFLTLLGPSGCGKTTMLRLIAGFEAPTSGSIFIDGADMTALPPYVRPVNTVFQDYALFPHMNVAENIGFGLSVARVGARERRRRVKEALALVALSEKSESTVHALSGGQRQRVALARALVNEPRVLLLDEPLAALDAHLREQMQMELKSLQTRLGTTFVMVTHDQSEALSISDRIVVLNKGVVEQIASPASLYDAPATPFVATFIGAMNTLEGVVVERRGLDILVDAAGLAVVAQRPQQHVEPGMKVTIVFRPEAVSLSAPGLDQVGMGQIKEVAFHGRALRVYIALSEGGSVMADIPRTTGGQMTKGSNFTAGELVAVRVADGVTRIVAMHNIGMPKS
jgi:spermidine/putrescine transport system ATP-binding protein